MTFHCSCLPGSLLCWDLDCWIVSPGRVNTRVMYPHSDPVQLISPMCGHGVRPFFQQGSRVLWLYLLIQICHMVQSNGDYGEGQTHKPGRWKARVACRSYGGLPRIFETFAGHVQLGYRLEVGQHGRGPPI